MKATSKALTHLLAIALSTAAGCGRSGSSSGRDAGDDKIAPIAADAMVFDSDRVVGGNYEIFRMKVDGTGVKQLTTDAGYDSWWPRLSPDRKKIIFYRTPKGVHDTQYEKASLWTMNADGSNVTLLRDQGTDGWAMQGHGEWSPDGKQLVMFGGTMANPQIYVTDTAGQSARRVTDGTGYWLDPAWSPDGTRIVAVACAGACTTTVLLDGLEVFTLAADGGDTPLRLTTDSLRDHDPYYSPDGSQIAWLTQTQPASPVAWNIRIAAIDGSGLDNVTNDSNINSKPDWSPDGSRIYFHRFVYGDSGWKIWSIQPDGSMLTLIPGQTGNSEYPDN